MLPRTSVVLQMEVGARISVKRGNKNPLPFKSCSSLMNSGSSCRLMKIRVWHKSLGLCTATRKHLFMNGVKHCPGKYVNCYKEALMKEVCFCTLITPFCFILQALKKYKISKKDKYFVKCFLKKSSLLKKQMKELNFGVLFGFFFFLRIWNMFVKTAKALAINAITKNKAFI